MENEAEQGIGSITVVIPCYNERDSIASVVRAMPPEVTEIIVVDNNSTDGSADVARAAGAIVVHEPIQGYGAALRGGFLAATGDIIAALDADNQYPADQIVPMAYRLHSEKLDFVSATRFPLSDKKIMSTVRQVGNWGFTTLTNVLFLMRITDSQSGMWVFKRSLLPRILPESHDMPFSQELKIRAYVDREIAYAEHQINYYERIGTSKLFPFRHGLVVLRALLVLWWDVVVLGRTR